jgi:hypothetical protein
VLKTLRERLGKFNPDELRHVADFWAVSLEGRPPDQWEEVLHEALPTELSARYLIEQLDEKTGPALEWLLDQDDATSDLHWLLLRLDKAKGRAFLDRLARAALLEILGPITIKEPWGHTYQAEKAVVVFKEWVKPLKTALRELHHVDYDRSAWRLGRILHACKAPVVQAMAKQLGLSTEGYKEAMSQRIRVHVGTPERAHSVLTGLSLQAQQVYEYLVAHRGGATMDDVRQATGLTSVALRAALEELAIHALAFDTFHLGERFLFLPREVVEQLLPQAQPVVETAEIGLEMCQPPPVVRTTTLALYWDAALLLDLLAKQKVKLNKSDGLLPRRQAKTLDAALSAVPPELGVMGKAKTTQERLKPLLQRLGWLGLVREIKRGRPLALDAARWQAWQTLDLRDQALAWLRAWMGTKEWLAYYAWDRGQYADTRDLAAARQKVLDSVGQAEPGVWFSVASLANLVKARVPYFLHDQERLAKKYGPVAMNDVMRYWDQIERLFIAEVLWAPLHGLGLVDLGYEATESEKPHQPSAFCLTPLGAAALGEEKTWSVVERVCVVQPNFEALLTELEPATLYRLLEIAEPLGFDRVGRLRFTRERALNAAERGRSATQVLADLSACSQGAVPQNVAVTIREWMGEGRPARLTKGWLLEVDDAETAQAILSDKRLYRYVERAVGPTALILRAKVGEEQVSAALRKGGFFPRVIR